MNRPLTFEEVRAAKAAEDLLWDLVERLESAAWEQTTARWELFDKGEGFWGNSPSGRRLLRNRVPGNRQPKARARASRRRG